MEQFFCTRVESTINNQIQFQLTHQAPPWKYPLNNHPLYWLCFMFYDRYCILQLTNSNSMSLNSLIYHWSTLNHQHYILYLQELKAMWPKYIFTPIMLRAIIKVPVRFQFIRVKKNSRVSHRSRPETEIIRITPIQSIQSLYRMY